MTGRCCLRGLLLLICAAASAAAQQWTAGLRTGISQGGFTGSREFSWGFTQPATSLFLVRTFGARSAVVAEVTHARHVGESQPTGSTLKLTADYLQLPLLARFGLPLDRVTPYALGGPFIGLKLRCTFEFSGGGIRSEDDCDSDRGVQSNKVDFGLTAGAGLATVVGIASVGIEGRYTAGMRAFVVPLDERQSRSYGWSVQLVVSKPLRTPARAPSPAPPPRVSTIVRAGPPAAGQPAGGMALPAAFAQRVTVRSGNARSLLLALARESGLNIVVWPDVKKHVSLSLSNVTAYEAINAIMDAADLSLVAPAVATSPAVFYRLPTDVNQNPAGKIRTKAAVNAELAKWVGVSRSAPSRPR